MKKIYLIIIGVLIGLALIFGIGFWYLNNGVKCRGNSCDWDKCTDTICPL